MYVNIIIVMAMKSKEKKPIIDIIELKTALMRENITMADIARELGTTRQTVSAVINGKHEGQYLKEIGVIICYLKGKYPTIFKSWKASSQTGG